MAEHLIELCVLLVEDLYGELPAQLFSHLAQLGRLTLPSLLQHTQLGPKQLRRGLVILIQQHLCRHFTASDAVSYYEADLGTAYSLVRCGKIIKEVQDVQGEAASGIVANLLLLGHAKVSDLADAYGVATRKKQLDPSLHHLNGNGLPDKTSQGREGEKKSSNNITSLAQLHRHLRQLLDGGYITKVRAINFEPSADTQNLAENIVRRGPPFGGMVKAGKQQVEFKGAVNNLKRRWRDDGRPEEAEEEDEAEPGDVKTGSKRSMGVITKSNKRVKLNGHLSNGVNGHIEDELPPAMVLRVNYEKLAVAFRTQCLVDLAARYCGETTAIVYETMLRILEKKITRCFDDLADSTEEEDVSSTVTTMQVAEMMDPRVDLAAGLSTDEDEVKQEEQDAQTLGIAAQHMRLDRGEGSNGARRTIGGDEGEARRQRLSLVERHIKILGNDTRKFVEWRGARGRGEWRVDFRLLTKTMILTELDNTITARFGVTAKRIMHILDDKGKLDEKQIAQLGLMRPKDIRSTLVSMHEAGFSESQEIPKDATRQPSRTMFLWYFDRDRCRRMILTDSYKAMARLLQRRKVEQARVQSVIDKAERTDVVGNEEKYLTPREKQELRHWRETEEKLLTQLERQDQLVTLLRDFTADRAW